MIHKRKYQTINGLHQNEKNKSSIKVLIRLNDNEQNGINYLQAIKLTKNSFPDNGHSQKFNSNKQMINNGK